MTDYTDLIARLLRISDFVYGDDLENAVEALKAQARRIVELEEDCEMRRAVNFGQSQTIDGYVARIAELEAEIYDAHEVLSMCDIPFHGDDGVEYSLPQRLKTRVKEQRAAYLGEKE